MAFHLVLDCSLGVWIRVGVWEGEEGIATGSEKIKR